jgi:hypothetical protein
MSMSFLALMPPAVAPALAEAPAESVCDMEGFAWASLLSFLASSAYAPAKAISEKLNTRGLTRFME